MVSMAQSIDLAAEEIKLEQLLLELRAAENNAEKKLKNKAFKVELERVLQTPEAMDYPFSKLTTIGFIDSPDGQMRIVNWNVEQDDFSQKYSCFILHIDSRRKTYYVTELTEDVMGMPMSQPTEILASNEWYGALYYKIIPVKKGSKTLYTVLGWDYYSTMSQIRLIDVIYFTGKTVKLGSPIFKIGKETKKRMYYEHSKKAGMGLTYEPQRDRIMMDHLSPETPSMKNFRSFYVPDLSYDAFVLESGKWILNEDVIGVNSESSSRQSVYVLNDNTGVVEEREIRSEWINPEDNGPGGGSEHVAVTPESAAEAAEAVATAGDPNAPEVNGRDRRDPSNLSTVQGNRRDRRRRRRRNRN